MKIVIADDHDLLRRALRDLLSPLANDLAVLEAADRDTTLARLSEHPDADLAIVDLMMPGMTGADSLVQMKRLAPMVPLAVLSSSEDPEPMRAAFDAGVAGFMVKSESPAVILSAVRLILSGGIYIPPALFRSVMRDRPAGDTADQALTPRQADVLDQLRAGLSNKEIARKLGMSEATVKAHLTAIFRALHIRNRAQAVMHPSE